MNIIKFGIVGVGNIGSRHCEHVLKNSRAKLVAICDIDKAKADAAAKKYGCKAVYDINDLLKQDIDVVNVCTPSGLHAEMSIKALEAKKNVLCEKPMCLNLVDADKIVDAEKISGKKFMLVKQNRYNPPVKALKNAVFKKSLGKISLLHCDVLCNRRKEYYMQAPWRGTMNLDGGALMTQCSHFLDLMTWIGGPVKSIDAHMININHPYIEVEDTGFVTLIFENGAIGSLQYTTSVYEKNMEGSMTVLGTLGSVKIAGEYLNVLEYWNVQDVQMPILEKGAEANDYGTYKGSMSNHDKVIENVVKVLNGEEDIMTNSIQGRESIEVMQAAYISAIEHKEITLPLRGAHYKFKINEEPPITGNKKVDK